MVYMNNNITTKSDSTIKLFKNQNKINDQFLAHVSSISLEDLIAIKFELAASNINNRLYGFDIWRNSQHIVKDAILKFAISKTKSKKDAARFLGLTYSEFSKLCKKYETNNFFKDNKS